MKQYKTRANKIFNAVNITFLILVSATCLLPFIHLLAVSFSGSAAVNAGKVGLLPATFLLDFDNGYAVRTIKIKFSPTPRTTLSTEIKSALRNFPPLSANS